MEPPNKGHVQTRSFVLNREVSFIWRLKCTGIIGVGMYFRERCSLFRGSFIGGSTVYSAVRLALLPHILHMYSYCTNT